jgi:hypothetical protein
MMGARETHYVIDELDHFLSTPERSQVYDNIMRSIRQAYGNQIFIASNAYEPREDRRIS